MDFISQLFNPAQSNFDPLNFLGLIGTILASIYIFRKQTTDAFVKERHDKLIFPLFNTLEPFLYQREYSTVLEKALFIIEENKNLADGKLLELYYNCSTSPSYEAFRELCFYIDKLYDKSCKKLGLRTRSLVYRINRGQYKNIGFIIVLAVIVTIFTILVAFLAFSLVLVCIELFISMIETADYTTKIIILLFLLVLMFAIQKYVIEKF